MLGKLVGRAALEMYSSEAVDSLKSTERKKHNYRGEK